MPAGLREVQIHPSKRLALPGGGHADVDLAMIPLMNALWACGIGTLGCCQDLGESIENNGHGSPVPARHRQRHADFYKGRAWLKMPVRDARRLVAILGMAPVFAARLRRWTHPEAWQCVVSVFPADGDHARLADAAQINFPATQIEEVAVLLGGRRQPQEPV